MNVTKKIEKKIKRMQEGTTFKYEQLGIKQDEYSAAAKAIERLIEKGVIKRVSTGIFYKPKDSAFGELSPREEELLKPYLFEGNKRIAYITGIALYNRMGLTTQVPKTIKVASKEKRVTTRIGNTEVKPVKSYIKVTSQNYYLLQFLDALKDFKKIPDLDKKRAIDNLLNRLENMKLKEQERIIKYALKYPPRTKALLGALLDEINFKQDFKKLNESLNPLTTYHLGVDKRILSTAPDWNIK